MDNFEDELIEFVEERVDKILLKLKKNQEYNKIYEEYNKKRNEYIKSKSRKDFKKLDNILNMLNGLNYIEFNEIYKIGLLDGIHLNKDI